MRRGLDRTKPLTDKFATPQAHISLLRENPCKWRSSFLKLGILLFLGILWTLGCSRDTEGIFYSLEQEEKAIDNSLPNDVRITGNMIKVTLGSEDRYYICAGSLFYRTTDLADNKPWTQIKSPISYGIVSGVAEVGGRIYVSLSNGEAHGLFRLTPDGNQYEPNENLYSAKQILRLFTLNNTLFASVGTILDDTFELLFWNGTALIPTGVHTYKIVAGAWDGANYWFASPSDLFRFSTAPSQNGWVPTPYYSYLSYTQNSTSPDPAFNGKSYFTDLFADSSDPTVSSPPYPVYLCSSDGYILKTKDGGLSWKTSGDHNRSFQSISKVKEIIVLGAGGSVVRELPKAVSEDDLDTSEAPGGNFTRLPDLYGSNAIRVFGFGDILYVGTTANGLWRGDYSTDPKSPVWSQE